MITNKKKSARKKTTYRKKHKRRSFVRGARARVLAGFVRFDKMESSGAIVMALAAVVAFVIANTNLWLGFHEFFAREFVVGWGSLAITLSPELFVNDILMAFFFLIVGIEIKRELLVGELADFKKALLPALAAVGGIIVPAVIYLGLNVVPGQNYPHGWGVPVATDIAFALGVLSFLSGKVPASLKVFLTALAIVDDLGAILIIALFYSFEIHWVWLLIGFAVVVVMFICNRLDVSTIWIYLVLGFVLLYCCLRAGIHPTIAGVVTAFMLPAMTGATRGKPTDEQLENSPLTKAENIFITPSTYVILPLFALANAGVRLVGVDPSVIFANHATWGVFFGLLVGKPLGILAACMIAVKAKVSKLPSGVGWGSLLGAGMLAGIGFTMSIFVSNLAFPNHPEVVNAVKASILAASILAGIGGSLFVRFLLPKGRARKYGRQEAG